MPGLVIGAVRAPVTARTDARCAAAPLMFGRTQPQRSQERSKPGHSRCAFRAGPRPARDVTAPSAQQLPRAGGHTLPYKKLDAAFGRPRSLAFSSPRGFAREAAEACLRAGVILGFRPRTHGSTICQQRNKRCDDRHNIHGAKLAESWVLGSHAESVLRHDPEDDREGAARGLLLRAQASGARRTTTSTFTCGACRGEAK